MPDATDCYGYTGRAKSRCHVFAQVSCPVAGFTYRAMCGANLKGETASRTPAEPAPGGPGEFGDFFNDQRNLLGDEGADQPPQGGPDAAAVVPS